MPKPPLAVYLDTVMGVLTRVSPIPAKRLKALAFLDACLDRQDILAESPPATAVQADVAQRRPRDRSVS